MKRRNGYRGDISIDDVTLRDGPCNPPQTTGAGGVTQAPNLLSLSQCTFQTGLCGFTQMKGTDKFDWTRDKSGTGTTNTGPSLDHTTNTTNGETKLLFYVLSDRLDIHHTFRVILK